MNVEENHDINELTFGELDAISGGRDFEREKAVIEAYKLIEQMELDLIDVEPVPYVPMKL